jgi:hypothetical protein
MKQGPGVAGAVEAAIMRKSVVGGLVLAVSLAGADTARAEDALVEQVQKAIDQGKIYLLNQASWETNPYAIAYPGAQTSLVVLALLQSGVPPSHDRIQKALKYLRTVESDRTYVLGLQTMAFAQAGEAIDRGRIERNARALLESRQGTGWGYHPVGAGAPGNTDNSNSQYALLGLHAAIEARVPVDRQALLAVRDLYLRKQHQGGWGYRPDDARHGRATLTMTTAGLCNLLITGMDLEVGKQVLHPDGTVEHCGEYDDNTPVRKALDRLAEMFPSPLTQGNAAETLGSPYYALYGIERAGRLSGRRFFGEHDWYEAGCNLLVKKQDGDGSWQNFPGNGFQASLGPLVNTSFALLFLSKGRTPVLLTKLAYGGPHYNGWNNKHNDLRHLADFAAAELFKGKPMAWQIFDVRNRNIDNQDKRRELARQLLQSPLVYFNGHDQAPSGAEEEILKEYLDNGGFVFAEACCGPRVGQAFDADFRALMRRLFRDNELKKLPPDHPIWTASGKFAVPPNEPFELWGIQHGCKWVVIYSPQQMAGHWEANDKKSKRGRMAFELMGNIIAYATGLVPPQPRLTEKVLLPDDSNQPQPRGYVRAVQLRYEGDWQPAPKAMRSLMAELRKAGLDTILETRPVFPSAKEVEQFLFFYMHGRSAFPVDDPQDLKALHFKLTEGGGLLLADACCGSKAFDESFRKLTEALFGADKLKLEPIHLSDELYSAQLNGEAIRSVKCRRLREDGKSVDPNFQTLPPDLEGIKYKGRWVVIYSRYDLGCALEGNAGSDCLGHDQASAMRLGRAAVLYALKP